MLAQLITAFFAVYGFYCFILCAKELIDKWMNVPHAPDTLHEPGENDKDDSQDDGKSL